jgi:dihydropyrimidinase
MAEYDLAVRGGLVAGPFGAAHCDVGVRDGPIAVLAERIADAARVVEADGLLVLPGGVDAHCHIEEPAPDGFVQEESFVTASASAFAGSTTSVVCFLPQWKGQSVLERYKDHRRRGAAG